MKPRDWKRRRFLETAAAATLGAGAGCGTASRWRVLSAAEAETLAAVCDQIIPPDGTPGAVWAGALGFIDRQLSVRWPGLRPKYREGVAELNRISRDRHAKPFAGLAAEQQASLLREIDKGSGAAKEFFNMVVSHTMQSFYGNPRHGGNRDAVSWKMLGIPPAPIRGRQGGNLPPTGREA